MKTKFMYYFMLILISTSFKLNATFDYKAKVLNETHHVVVGQPIFINLAVDTIGNNGSESIDVNVISLPPNCTSTLLELTTFCCNTFIYAIPYTTSIKISTSPATPTGTYTLSFQTVSKTTFVTKNINYIIYIDPIPTQQALGPCISNNVPVPFLSKYNSDMLFYGNMHCNTTSLLDTYYDAEYVYYQIGDYTGNTSWTTCVNNSEALYRDGYLIPNNCGIPAYWIFPHGLYYDYVRTGDTISKNRLIQLSNNAAFSSTTNAVSALVNCGSSREVAYNMRSYILTEMIGQPHKPKLETLLSLALGHIDQWSISKNINYYAPFMGGITCESLILYHDSINNDPRILPAIKTLLDFTWNYAWNASDSTFAYSTSPDGTVANSAPAPDLNLLISPAYAWVYHMTGDTSYLRKADKIFAGGVKGAWLNGGKQFNQNYRWSFHYLKWRNATPLNCLVTSLTSNNSIKNDFSFYPNPADNKLSVVVNNEHNSGYSLIDVLGKEIKSGLVMSNKIELDVSDLKEGIYFLRVNNQKQKIVIQH